jgi:hypothetical protein
MDIKYMPTLPIARPYKIYPNWKQTIWQPWLEGGIRQNVVEACGRFLLVVSFNCLLPLKEIF